jgi:hypothetical protein
MHKYLGALSAYSERKDDPTYAVEVIITDPAPSFTVIESWGTAPNRTANIFRYGAPSPPGEYVQLTFPTRLVPKIVAALSDPQVQADFLACIGGMKTAAMEGE